MAVQPRGTRARVLKEARTWIGTPYHHQASTKGAGCDCLGLVRGIWRARYGAEPETPPAYAGDWAEASGEELMLEAAQRHMKRLKGRQRAASLARPGDMVLMRMLRTGPAKHMGIVETGGMIIHATETGGVCRVPFDESLKRRTVAAFAFPVVRMARG